MTGAMTSEGRLHLCALLASVDVTGLIGYSEKFLKFQRKLFFDVISGVDCTDW